MNYDFDTADRVFRQSDPRLDKLAGDYTLTAEYDSAKHRYSFKYRGRGFSVEERLIMWEEYPMNKLAEQVRNTIEEINGEENFGWKPREEELTHSQILVVLEKMRHA